VVVHESTCFTDAVWIILQQLDTIFTHVKLLQDSCDIGSMLYSVLSALGISGWVGVTFIPHPLFSPHIVPWDFLHCWCWHWRGEDDMIQKHFQVPFD